MRDPGRIAAAIAILADIEARRHPAKLALKEWGAANRIAGSKDRAWISGLVLDTLRHRRSFAYQIGVDTPRAAVLACLRLGWGWTPERIAEAAADGPHAPGALTPEESAGLDAPADLSAAPLGVRADAPDWIAPHLERAFGEHAAKEGAALTERAGLDLRVNTLKTDPERALEALKLHAPAPGALTTTVRLAAAAAEARGGHVESIPAFSKGWFEIQDQGSQVAAASAGELAGRQVLDLCAGGGGKTLALGAMMANSGQLFAYDADARRLAPLIERAQRAGLRNLQVRSPASGDTLEDLTGRMDVVFVDAPCTGSGVWRRQPDAKWRLRAGQLGRRIEEQDAVLDQAAAYVKPGGRLVYATCSWLVEENEDRLVAFRARHRDFAPASALTGVRASGLLAPSSLDRLRACSAPDGALRLTPANFDCDGFFIAVLTRSASA